MENKRFVISVVAAVTALLVDLLVYKLEAKGIQWEIVSLTIGGLVTLWFGYGAYVEVSTNEFPSTLYICAIVECICQTSQFGLEVSNFIIKQHEPSSSLSSLPSPSNSSLLKTLATTRIIVGCFLIILTILKVVYTAWMYDERISAIASGLKLSYAELISTKPIPVYYSEEDLSAEYIKKETYDRDLNMAETCKTNLVAQGRVLEEKLKNLKENHDKILRDLGDARTNVNNLEAQERTLKIDLENLMKDYNTVLSDLKASNKINDDLQADLKDTREAHNVVLGDLENLDKRNTYLKARIVLLEQARQIENKDRLEALTTLSKLKKVVHNELFLLDIGLLESELYFSLRNLPKAKAALTAARTAANAIDVPPAQQGTIDLQWGILHAEEKDYNTAYNYFGKAFEAFNALEDPRAIFSLKYMLLCKIMANQTDDVAEIISFKAGLQYVGVELDAMKAVADARSKRSLKFIETALRDYKAQLEEDPIVHRHLSSLYDTLLEENLCRLIEPFSRVEIDHIAKLIELPVRHVEKKLSQMILNKKFAGTIDQGTGCLNIFDEPKADADLPAILELITNMGKVVDSLNQKYANMQR